MRRRLRPNAAEALRWRQSLERLELGVRHAQQARRQTFEPRDVLGLGGCAHAHADDQAGLLLLHGATLCRSGSERHALRHALACHELTEEATQPP